MMFGLSCRPAVMSFCFYIEHEPVEQVKLESFHGIFEPGYKGWFTFMLVELMLFYA